LPAHPTPPVLYPSTTLFRSHHGAAAHGERIGDRAVVEVRASQVVTGAQSEILVIKEDGHAFFGVHEYLLCQAACSRQVVEVGFSGVGVCVRASAWARVRVRQRRRAIWFFRQRRASITVFPSARSRS